MGGGKAPQPLPPSPEERALQAEQTQLLRLQRDLIGQQQAQASLLEPVILRQSGLEKIFVGTPGDPGLGKKISDLEQQRAKALKIHEAGPGGGRTAAFNLATKGMDDIDRQLAQLRGQAQGSGGYEIRELPGFAEQRRRQEGIEAQRSGVESLSLSRQEAALRGELPLDPGLLKDLASREELTREALRRNIGSGFETSTAGANALREFEAFRQSALASARRGDIEGLSPLSFGGSGRFQYRAPESFTGLTSAFPSAYGNVAQGFQGQSSYLAQQRQNQYQGQLASYQQGGSMAGGILGALGGAAAGLAAIPTGGGSLAAYAGALGGGLSGGLSGYRF